MSWITFPQFVSDDITLRVDTIDTTYSLHPTDNLDGVNLGAIASELRIMEVAATITPVNPKASTVQLRVRIERLEDNGTRTQVLSFNRNLNPLWTDDGNSLTGDFILSLANENLLDTLVPDGNTYYLRVATPILWRDCVQDIQRFDEFSEASFTYFST